MTTRFLVNEAATVLAGTVMVSGTILEGPRLTVGQWLELSTTNGNLTFEVIGTGVSDPNLGPPGRQGILLRFDGDAGILQGMTLSS